MPPTQVVQTARLPVHRAIHSYRTPLALLVLVLSLLFMVSASTSAQFAIELRNAEAAILIEAETGQVLFEQAADESLPSASVAKLMTMLLTLEGVESGLISWDDVVRISANAAAIGGSQIWVPEGDTMTVHQLFVSVAIASANDASIALAEHISGSEQAFAQYMNHRAHELGMTNSHFINAHGYDADYEGSSLLSARDAAILAQHIVTNYPEVLEYTQTFRMDLGKTGRGHAITVENTNLLVLDPPASRVDGLKTGHTSEAGYHLVATAERDGTRLISVVFRAPTSNDRNQETRSLLQWGFRFNRVIIGEADERYPVEIPQATATAEVYAEAPVKLLVPSVQSSNIETEVVLYSDVRAPLKAGDEVGELVISLNGEEMARTKVFVAADVERMGFFARIWNSTVGFFAGLFD